MSSTYTLDENIIKYLNQIYKYIQNRKYWTLSNYEQVFKSLKVATKMVRRQYFKQTGTTLEETSRRLFEGVQGGGIDIFVCYYNAFLYIRKLETKVLWHQHCGAFPE